MYQHKGMESSLVNVLSTQIPEGMERKDLQQSRSVVHVGLMCGKGWESLKRAGGGGGVWFLMLRELTLRNESDKERRRKL